VNTVAPIAGSRLTATVLPEDLVEALKPEYVAPIVAYLCSEGCAETGGRFEMGAGWVGKLRYERTRGAMMDVDAMSPELVRSEWGTVTDFSTDTTHPVSNKESMGAMMEALSLRSKL
jgi:3-hydroxyacyl-CoA dehydrogenase/3a,7a,12a-trihydroxy-5b-cholest-24-enoyl-CoA hydratase